MRPTVAARVHLAGLLLGALAWILVCNGGHRIAHSVHRFTTAAEVRPEEARLVAGLPAGAGVVASLAAATAAVHTVADRVEENRLDHIQWLPGQWSVFHDSSRARLFRAGNQSQGKTWCGLAEALWEARGSHPYRPATSPYERAEVWILTASWSQSIAIQEKLWNLAPRAWVHPDATFDEKNGFGAKNPILKIKHRSGAYSTIRIKTTAQGGLNLAGASIHFALFDEPPDSQRIYTEVRKRLQSKGGRLLMTLTPVNRDCSYIKAEVDAGRLVDHHFPLRAEHLIPVGADRPICLADGTPCDQAWIDRVRAETMEYELPVVVDGEWEFRATGRVFEAFDGAKHVHRNVPGECDLLLGVDFGHDMVEVKGADGRRARRLGRQSVVLLAAWTDSEGRPCCYCVDAYRADKETTPRDDAVEILAMLERNGLSWTDLDAVFTDRVHMRGTAQEKGARDLQVAIARELRVAADKLDPRPRVAKRGEGRGAGSVRVGVRWLHHRMLTAGTFGIHPQARALIEAFERWDFRADSVWKDPIDAVRYALDRWIFARKRSLGAVVRVR